MIRARFSPRAALDLEEITGCIVADNAEAAQRVRHSILNFADLLAQHPELGRRIRKAATRHQPIILGANASRRVALSFHSTETFQ